MTDEERIMLDVLEQRAGREKSVDTTEWPNLPFGKIKRLSGSDVRDVGVDFIARLCCEIGVDCEFPARRRALRSWQNPWDMKINGVTFEVKTSTEYALGGFQFSHVRPHRSYEAVLCLGMAPDAILFGAWSKADIARAASSKPAAFDQTAPTQTLRKHRSELKPIEEFEEHIKLLTKALISSRYRSGSESDRRKMDLLVHLGLHEVPDDGKSLQETMTEVGHNAQKRGLTPEILQSILDEIDSDASVRI